MVRHSADMSDHDDQSAVCDLESKCVYYIT
jgi:hypothetical protein